MARKQDPHLKKGHIVLLRWAEYGPWSEFRFAVIVDDECGILRGRVMTSRILRDEELDSDKFIRASLPGHETAALVILDEDGCVRMSRAAKDALKIVRRKRHVATWNRWNGCVVVDYFSRSEFKRE